MISKIKEKFRSQRKMCWALGFIDDPIESVIAGKFKVKLVKHKYKDRWFADPFILDVDDKYIYLLVEEYKYSLKRGRIAELTIDKHTYECVDLRIVLDIDTHLSFPFIIRENGKVCIMPENYKSGGLKMYDWQADEHRLVNPRTVSSDLLTDAVLVERSGKKYILSTMEPNPNGTQLRVYSFDGTKAEPVDTITFGDNVARNGGDLLTVGDETYRVTQICNNTYGEGLSFQKLHYDGEHFAFEEVSRIKSPIWRWSEGMHTLNRYKGVCVVDMHGYRNYLRVKFELFLGRISRAISR